MIRLSRREIILAAAGLCVAAGPAHGEAWARDVGVYAEPTLAPALRAVGRQFTARTGAGVAVLTAPATLLLEQIQHNAAHDLLIVPPSFMDDAEKRGFVAPASRRNAWLDRLVIAGLAGGKPYDNLAARLADGIVVTDATVASSLDGRAALEGEGLSGKAKILGVANTQDAAFMVVNGAAGSALLYLTDVRADPALELAGTLEKAPPAVFSVALNPHPPSRNAQKFLDFLSTDQAVRSLLGAGLEIAA